MARRHIDPVEVLRSGGEPARFLWHDRLYVVREVLDHWMENEEWWQGRATGVTSATRTVARTAVAGTAAASAATPAGATAPGGTTMLAGAPERTSALGTPEFATEREVWRVEAAAGRCAPLGVFDLRLDAHGGWTLARTLD